MAKKVKMTIRKELVSTPTEEWNEWRVYRGKPKDGFSVASFKSEAEAEEWATAHAA